MPGQADAVGGRGEADSECACTVTALRLWADDSGDAQRLCPESSRASSCSLTSSGSPARSHPPHTAKPDPKNPPLSSNMHQQPSLPGPRQTFQRRILPSPSSSPSLHAASADLRTARLSIGASSSGSPDLVCSVQVDGWRLPATVETPEPEPAA